MPPRELLTRHPDNPILTWRDAPVPANAVYNPGAAKIGARTLLLLRLEDTRRDNRLHCAWSEDGVRFEIEPEPIALATPEEERPFAFFSLIFLVLALTSVGLGYPIVVEFLETGLVPRLPTAILATGTMLLAFLSLTSGLILKTVTRGRRELKRLHYLAVPALKE